MPYTPDPNNNKPVGAPKTQVTPKPTKPGPQNQSPDFLGSLFGLAPIKGPANPYVADGSNNQYQAYTPLFGANLKHVIYWGVAALALIALAKPYPQLATGFVVLLMVGVLLTHYKQYLALIGQ